MYLITFATKLFCLLLILASELSSELHSSWISLDFKLCFEVSFQVAMRCLSFIEKPFLVALLIFINVYPVFLASFLVQVV